MNPMNEIDYHRALKQLPRSAAPLNDLWPGIAQQLCAPQHQPQRRWWRLAAAASVLGAGFLASWLALLPNPEYSTVATSVEPMSRPWTLREAELIQTDVDAALSAVVQSGFNADPADFAPRAVQSSLRELGQAQGQLRAALQRSPGSAFLIERLRHVQQQRIRLTRQIFSAA